MKQSNCHASGGKGKAGGRHKGVGWDNDTDNMLTFKLLHENQNE